MLVDAHNPLRVGSGLVVIIPAGIVRTKIATDKESQVDFQVVFCFFSYTLYNLFLLGIPPGQFYLLFHKICCQYYACNYYRCDQSVQD